MRTGRRIRPGVRTNQSSTSRRSLAATGSTTTTGPSSRPGPGVMPRSRWAHAATWTAARWRCRDDGDGRSDAERRPDAVGDRGDRPLAGRAQTHPRHRGSTKQTVMTLTFTVFGVAQPKGNMRAINIPGMKFPIVTDSNRSVKSWSQLVAEGANRAIGALPAAERGVLEGPVRLTMAFYLPRPKKY